MPNLIEVQKDSYKWFLEKVSKRYLMIFLQSQITAVIESGFVDFTLCEDDVNIHDRRM